MCRGRLPAARGCRLPWERAATTAERPAADRSQPRRRRCGRPAAARAGPASTALAMLRRLRLRQHWAAPATVGASELQVLGAGATAALAAPDGPARPWAGEPQRRRRRRATRSSPSSGRPCYHPLLVGLPIGLLLALVLPPPLARRRKLRRRPLGADLLLAVRVVAVGAVDAPPSLPVPAELRLDLAAHGQAHCVELVLAMGEGADLAQGAVAARVAAAELLLLFEAQVRDVGSIRTRRAGARRGGKGGRRLL
mmetsp:Transcript_26572/g.82594  ORF Transcript_26572/g.82594 Transcript_26572/m.82594 type:complete len:253 (-) Transcript_26572:303-1061(-)